MSAWTIPQLAMGLVALILLAGLLDALAQDYVNWRRRSGRR